MELMELLLYSAVGFAIGIVLFVKGLGWMKQKRLIENTPTSKARSIAMGMVEVYGKAVPAFGKILKSPLMEKECVYYRFKVEERRGSGKSTRWVTILSGDDSIKFWLQDETGSVLVDPKGASVDIPADFSLDSHMGSDPPPTVQRLLKAHGMGFEGFLGINKSMRYAEHMIEPNNMVYVMGTAGDNPFKEEATAVKGSEDVMIQKGENETFYISDRQEKDILRSLGWKSAGGVFGGGLLTVGSLAVILLSLKII